MKKYLKYFTALFGFVVLLLTACTDDTGTDMDDNVDGDVDDDTEDVTETPDSLTGTYDLYVGGYDWGPAVDTVYVEFSETLDEVPTDALTISETKQVTDWTDETFPVVEETFELEIINAYFVDNDKEESTDPTETVAFEIAVDPNTANPLLYSMQTSRNTWSDPYYLTFELVDGASLMVDGAAVTDLTIEQEPNDIETVADDFDMDTFEASDGTNYEYAHFSPEEDSDTLFVWLHGGGEGQGPEVENTDPSVVLLANKASVLSKDEFQNPVGNAHVLVPQSPTMWLDMDGNQTYTTDGTSAYEESLRELINDYKEQVGAEKVVLAGPSNGGHMTLRMAVLFPDDYDALIPICHGYRSDWLTDDELDGIKHIPMFFIYAENDDTLDPLENSVPTIERLRAMDAAEIKVSATENVVDTSEEYTDEDGNPYEYDGHWSWIYFHNNESADDEDGTLVFDWIGEQVSE